MYCYNVNEQILTKSDQIGADSNWFIIAEPEEVLILKERYDLDESTIIDCLNYDENIRHEVFAKYDFISMLYFHIEKDITLLAHEMNLYVGVNFCIWVMPDQLQYAYLEAIRERVFQRIEQFSEKNLSINRIYYFIWDELLRDYFNQIQYTEDQINGIESYMLKHQVNKSFFQTIRKIRSTAYQIKKIMRPVLYIGDAILINENDLIKKDAMRFFRSIDIRINKLYDFSSSLQEYANQMMDMYEGHIAAQTNDIINKLTILTVFFTPLTVITGIYGMNFVYMPELQWRFGYLFSFLLMLSVVLVIYFIMKRNKWIK